MYLFAKPLLYGSFILIIDVCGWYIADIYEKRSFSRKQILPLAGFFFLLFIPALCESMHLLQSPAWIGLVLLVLYILIGKSAWLVKTMFFSGVTLKIDLSVAGDS
jgi:hypothetical protein